MNESLSRNASVQVVLVLCSLLKARHGKRFLLLE